MSSRLARLGLRFEDVSHFAVHPRENLWVVVQDLGDGFVFGVEFLGQREIRNRKVELGLRVELGAHTHRFLEELGIDTGECRRLSLIRKWARAPKTYENGPESYDSRPFSIVRSAEQQQLARSMAGVRIGDKRR